MPYAWFNGLDACLFALLAIGAGTRMRESFQLQHRTPVMLIVLSIYATSRAVALAFIALGKVPHDQSFAQNSLNSIPATFYALFQTALVWRWVKAVADLTAVLDAATFGSGDVVRFSSLILGIIQPVACLAAFIDIDCAKFTSLTANDWNVLMQLYGGFLYIYNGVSFLLLGLLLLRMWRQSAQSDRDAQVNRLRILLIAVVFANVTFFRGLMLVLFLFINSDKHVANLVQSSWGAPAVLFAEWWSIVISIFIIPILAPRTASSLKNTSMAGSGSDASMQCLVGRRARTQSGQAQTPRAGISSPPPSPRVSGCSHLSEVSVQ